MLFFFSEKYKKHRDYLRVKNLKKNISFLRNNGYLYLTN